MIPFDDANSAEYEDYPSLKDLMAVNSCGVKTHRDGIVIDCNKKTLVARMSDIATEHRLELLRERYGITDTPNWKLKDAQLKIRRTRFRSLSSTSLTGHLTSVGFITTRKLSRRAIPSIRRSATCYAAMSLC